jgi:anhydro-N-acetylmuramic acid kinase
MPELYIGLMSGTSLDGVDAALVDFSAGQQLLASHFLPYSDALRTEALALNSAGANEIHRASNFSNAVAELYAQATMNLLESSGVAAMAIKAIGAHGQTIRHRPDCGYTVQVCNASLLAERTGIAVVCDFRSRDIAAGGQGAPLVPAFHAATFASNRTHRLILNIGGIANLTDLPCSGPVKGFDTGPGNLLLDAWCARHTGQRFDLDGAWSAKGKVIGGLLAQFKEEPFFRLPPPKSTGRDLFNEAWLQQYDLSSYASVDVQATLLELSAQSITDSAAAFCAGAIEIYVCGGGAANGVLMNRIQANAPHMKVDNTQALGLHPDWVEAIAFAWLARQSLNNAAGNLPEVTGATGPRVLGAIYPK